MPRVFLSDKLEGAGLQLLQDAHLEIDNRPGLKGAELIAAMQAARLRQVESEIAHFLADNGGTFTDEAEREVERRFLSNPSRL